MRSSLLFFSLALFAFSLKAQPSTEFKKCPLGGVGFEVPDSLQLGDTLRYSITYTLPDGCATLIDMTIEERPGQIVHRLFRECPDVTCTDIVRAGMTSAVFIPKELGTVSFSIGIGDQTWSSVSLVVY